LEDVLEQRLDTGCSDLSGRLRRHERIRLRRLGLLEGHLDGGLDSKGLGFLHGWRVLGFRFGPLEGEIGLLEGNRRGLDRQLGWRDDPGVLEG
jgi:hypothetical protein